MPLNKTETARRRTLEAVRRLKESQRSETGTPPPPGVTSRKAMLCKERGAHPGRPCTQRIRSAGIVPRFTLQSGAHALRFAALSTLLRRRLPHNKTEMAAGGP